MNLVMENTIWMIMCIPLAYGLSIQRTEWFFQAMLLIIGGRYLTFSTIYGSKLYWLLGVSLGCSAYFLFRYEVESFDSLLTGAIVEILWGGVMYFVHVKSPTNLENKND